MEADIDLAGRFETERPRLRQVARRMLGSAEDADDAVQQSWIKASQADLADVTNLPGWLTTVLTRECLDQLRARKRRREVVLLDEALLVSGSTGRPGHSLGADKDAVLADEVGRALLVVLDRLSPTERVAFVLHDLFSVPFAEIAPVLDRSTATTKKLASRARQKVHPDRGIRQSSSGDERRVTAAFLTAARDGDLDALVQVLAPDVVRRADKNVLPAGVAAKVQGRDGVIGEIRSLGRVAVWAELVLINGQIGAVVAPRGQLLRVLRFTLDRRSGGEMITGYEVIGDPDRLTGLEIKLLE